MGRSTSSHLHVYLRLITARTDMSWDSCWVSIKAVVICTILPCLTHSYPITTSCELRKTEWNESFDQDCSAFGKKWNHSMGLMAFGECCRLDFQVKINWHWTWRIDRDSRRHHSPLQQYPNSMSTSSTSIPSRPMQIEFTQATVFYCFAHLRWFPSLILMSHNVKVEN